MAWAGAQLLAGERRVKLGAAQPVDRLQVPVIGGAVLGHQRA
jgi:hypothetical protein